MIVIIMEYILYVENITIKNIWHDFSSDNFTAIFSTVMSRYPPADHQGFLQQFISEFRIRGRDKACLVSASVSGYFR
ncbi:MAG: hypothetical protein CVU06_12200 [Bacteroidetes bacterium HGW-Bacteroidetes-22]|nr:MAG: hypothetical protein CVU06_12200 [Bacteroidetes bacterium HGW-Bacteroidetes-22]